MIIIIVIVKWIIRVLVNFYRSDFLLTAWETTIKELCNDPSNVLFGYHIDQIKRMIYKKGDITAYINMVETYGQARTLTPIYVLNKFIDYSLARNDQGRIDLCRRAIYGNLKAYIINIVMPLMQQPTRELITEKEIDYMTKVIEVYAITHMKENAMAKA